MFCKFVIGFQYQSRMTLSSCLSCTQHHHHLQQFYSRILIFYDNKTRFIPTKNRYCTQMYGNKFRRRANYKLPSVFLLVKLLSLLSSAVVCRTSYYVTYFSRNSVSSFSFSWMSAECCLSVCFISFSWKSFSRFCCCNVETS